MLKIIGAVFLVAGTAIGAGMLALPIACGTTGFAIAMMLLATTWVVMTYSALLILEVNLTLELEHNSFSSMAYHTLGRPAQIIAWICTLLLLYSLTAAYISGNASILQLLIKTVWHKDAPYWLNIVAFITVFGTIVAWSTRCVDIINRLFFSIKGILLVLTLSLLLPEVHIDLLTTNNIGNQSLQIAPIFITAFAFHTVIPSITNYMGKQPHMLRRIILTGATLPLIIYTVWLITTLGIIPAQGPISFSDIQHHHGDVALLLDHLIVLTNSRWIHIGIQGFANIAMVTSFLGVTLGLFDFLADGFKRDNSAFGRLQTALLTFLPPLLFAFLYPQGFLLALEFAAIFVVILEMILPAMMAYQSRKSRRNQTPADTSYQVFGGNTGLVILALAGIAILLIEIGRSFFT